ncbi:MAG: ABC transporter ATP-binding protein/permease [Thiobacillaceae bacterium]
MAHVSKHSPPGPADWKTLLKVTPYLWEHRGRVLVAIACLVLAKLATVAVPITLKYVVDDLDPTKGPLAVPVFLVVAYGVLRLMTTLFNDLRDIVFARVTQGTIRRVGLEVFRHLHNLSLRFHLDRQTGGITRDVERGAQGISALVNYFLFRIAPTLLEIALVGGILLVKFDWVFAAITVGVLLLYIAMTIGVTEWRTQFRRRMNELDSQANTRAVDSLINYETVKYFGNEKFEVDRYDNSLKQWEEASVKSQTSLSLLNVGQAAIIALGMTLILLKAASGVADKTLTLGDLVMINAFLIQLFIPLNFLGVMYREIKQSLTDIERMFKLLRSELEIRDKPDAPALKLKGGVVRFENVSFAYDTERPILHEVSFEIPAGHNIAVVGTSGAGKSTLARLLFRFYDVTGGRVTVDGQDIRNVTQDSLRAAIGIVPQDTVLFNDTLYYNVAYGRPDAAREEVMAAARSAHLQHFIESLPRQWDTVVGERGLKLSGGEKQRVAIARTLLKNPKILVLDEATSALDTRTERIIQGELREIAGGRTTLTIAHRLSTIVDADEILVMEYGRIVERGRHAELLVLGGIYARLWALQLQEERNKPPEAVAA